MIIYSNGNYAEDSRYPDELFDDAAIYVLPDGSSIAEEYKRIMLTGCYPQIITDSEGNITGVKKQADASALKIEREELRRSLQEGDYKVIKCMEATLTGGDLPYDINELKAARDELRARINKLEEKIEEIESES